MSAASLLAVLTLAAAQGEPTLRITPSTAETEFGAPFALTVERTWPADCVAEPWSDAALAPLRVALLDSEQRTIDGVISETRRYRARAFTLGELIVSAPWFRATPRDGGAARIAFADELRLSVRSALPEPAGDVELPGPPFAAPRRPAVALVASALALVLLALGWSAVRRRRRRAPGAPESTAAERALRALGELRARDPRGAAEHRAHAVAVATALRTYLEERFSLGASRQTTEELLAAASQLAARHRELVAASLDVLDRAKFARFAPDEDARVRVLDGIERFVRETASA
jgi:hypothetical protein